MKSNIFRNATFSAAQTIISALLLFFLYRYLLKALGSEQLGIWAVVLASTSVARLSDMGLSGAALKFVAKNFSAGKNEDAADVVQTACISIAIVLSIILVIAYPFLKYILSTVIPESSLPQAILILPWAMLSLLLGLVAGIFQSALDGCNRMDMRNIISMFCNLLYFCSVFWLVPNYGLEGLAVGQMLQGLSLLLLSWLFLRRQLTTLPWAPYIWKKNQFKEIYSYALHFQISGFAAMLFDPLIKYLLAKFGGLSEVAFYEMANQLISKARAILISAFQAVIPEIAGTSSDDHVKLQDLYTKSYSTMTAIVIPYFFGITVALPFISILWIGHFETRFLIFGAILSMGWMLANIGVPAFFYNIGTGRLSWNTASQIGSTSLLLVLGWISGKEYGGYGVVTAAMFAAAVANFCLVIAVHQEMKMSTRALIPNSHMPLYASVIVGLLTACCFFILPIGFISNINLSILAISAYSLAISKFLWVHPAFGIIRRKFSRN